MAGEPELEPEQPAPKPAPKSSATTGTAKRRLSMAVKASSAQGAFVQAAGAEAGEGLEEMRARMAELERMKEEMARDKERMEEEAKQSRQSGSIQNEQQKHRCSRW